MFVGQRCVAELADGVCRLVIGLDAAEHVHDGGEALHAVGVRIAVSLYESLASGNLDRKIVARGCHGRDSLEPVIDERHLSLVPVREPPPASQAGDEVQEEKASQFGCRYSAAVVDDLVDKVPHTAVLHDEATQRCRQCVADLLDAGVHEFDDVDDLIGRGPDFLPKPAEARRAGFQISHSDGVFI